MTLLEPAMNNILDTDLSKDNMAPLWLDKVLYRPDFIVGTAIAGLIEYIKSLQ